MRSQEEEGGDIIMSITPGKHNQGLPDIMEKCLKDFGLTLIYLNIQ